MQLQSMLGDCCWLGAKMRNGDGGRRGVRNGERGRERRVAIT